MTLKKIGKIFKDRVQYTYDELKEMDTEDLEVSIEYTIEEITDELKKEVPINIDTLSILDGILGMIQIMTENHHFEKERELVKVE